MPIPDDFALTHRALNAFLMAEVGTEPNGSALTILSLLARLDFDPWREAAGWVRLPRVTAIESLTRAIAATPLAGTDQADAKDTATRLIDLLPERIDMPARSQSEFVMTKKTSACFAAFLFTIIALGIALNDTRPVQTANAGVVTVAAETTNEQPTTLAY